MRRLLTIFSAGALGVEVTDDALSARLQIATLDHGRIRMPRKSNLTYALVEAGCSDQDTLIQDILPHHPQALSLSFEPLLDKYAFHVGNASAEFHGKNAMDLGVPLGHASRRSIVLPLAISEDGGVQTIYVSPVAGCSSLAKVNSRGTWANAKCRSVMESRLVDSITLADAIALVPPTLPILRLKIDVQGVDFRVVRSVPADVLRSRVVFLDVEVRKKTCATLYEGQEDCAIVLSHMASIGFDLVLPGAAGSTRTLPGCAHLPWDNACEANARFLNRAMRGVAGALPLPYIFHSKKTWHNLPKVDEEHGR